MLHSFIYFTHVLITFISIGTGNGVVYNVRRDVFEYQKVLEGNEHNKMKMTNFKNEKSYQYFPFRNLSLSYNERVNDIVSRLTLDEVVLQLSMGGANNDGPAPAIPHLGIGPFQWNNECLRGFMSTINTTAYPMPIGLAATWDPNLVKEMAKTVGLEARASWRIFSDKGQFQDHTGLNCFAPVINILRHPLWGRIQETYGEDPYLTSEFAKHYVHGLQGENDKYIAASATCKHFDVHGGPENIPENRFRFNAVVSEQDWQMTFLPAFKQCLRAGAYSVMCSYNAINGVPSCANQKLLTDILRNEFHFDGFVVSDEGAIENIDLFFNYTKSPLGTAVAAVTAGVNLELTQYDKKNRFFLLKDAVAQKRVTESLLRDRLKPLFFTRMKLGEFDPPQINPYYNVPADILQSWEHRELAATIASKTFVLLKNMDKTLPIHETNLKISLVGPFINNSEALTGHYAPYYDLKYFISPIKGIQKMTTVPVTHTTGCIGGKEDKFLPKCLTIDKEEIINKVTDRDVVVVTLGTGWGIESESKDRADIQLPGKQLEILQLVVENARKDAKIILLLFNAGPLDIKWALESPKVNAVIACHFPAQTAGEAIFRVLTGIENPAARLPNTWPASLDQIPSITNYTMHERTYRYSTTKPLLPFGYGLSYTTFSYSDFTIDNSIEVCGDVAFSLKVENTGELYGEEVVQIYMTWPDTTTSISSVPNLQLVAFKRIALKPKESHYLNLLIIPDQRAIWTDQFVLKPGTYTVYGGGQQPNQLVKISSNIVSGTFEVTGEETPLNSC